jgi:predicted ATPase
VLCLSRAAQTLWLLGYPTQALQRSREAITLAQELFRPWILTWALEYDAGIHYLRREGQLTRERTEAVIALASEQGFVAALAEATMLRGWALAEQGQGEEGVAQIRQGLAVYRTLESEVAWTYYLGRLAEAYGKVGQPAEGLNVLDEALGLVHKNGEHFWEAELYRLKGELLLQSKVERRKAKGEGQKSKMTTSHS